MPSPNRVIAKDVKSCTYVRCATLGVGVGEMPWTKTGATNYHSQLGFPDKGRAIKVIVVCNSCDISSFAPAKCTSYFILILFYFYLLQGALTLQTIPNLAQLNLT